MSEITTTGKKSFWEKPEGLWGMCILALLGGGILWFLSWFVPFMLTLGLGLLGLGLVWGTIVALAYTVFTNNVLRQAIVLKVQNFSRKLRHAVINEDPIGILRDLITKAMKRMEEFDELRKPVFAAQRSVSNAAALYKDTLDNLNAEYAIKQRQGDADATQRALIKIGKTQKLLDEMIALGTDVNNMNTMLGKASKVVNQIVEDAKFEINNEEIKLKAVTSVNGAWKKLRSVFKSNTDESNLREEALRAVAEQCDAKLGEVDMFMEEFKTVLDTVGTQDAINAEKARQKMDALTQSSNGLVLPNNPSPVIQTSLNTAKATVRVKL